MEISIATKQSLIGRYKDRRSCKSWKTLQLVKKKQKKNGDKIEPSRGL